MSKQDFSKDFSKSFMYSVHQMYFLVQKHLEHVLSIKSPISFSQFMILVGFQCGDSKIVSQSEIAERLYLTEATVSRHMSTLVDRGLVVRSENKDNRRKHILSITPAGQKAFKQASLLIDKELDKIFSVIKEKDRKGIMQNFSHVLEGLLNKK
jgi:DNA-binding MarR family transcriptional regulator